MGITPPVFKHLRSLPAATQQGAVAVHAEQDRMLMGQSGPARVPLYRFWAPRFWPLWLGFGLLRMAVLLPWRVQMQIGRGIGALLYRVLGKRRDIAARNLALCFPDEDAAWHQQMLHEHFASLGMAVMELGLGWWASEQRLESLVHVEGLENLLDATREGQGVLVLSGHFTATELTGRIVRRELPGLAAIYRPSRNPLLDEMLRRGRGRVADALIPKDGMRLLLRTLKQGTPVWYAPDQSYRGRFSALVDFCGEPAMTNTALTQLVRMSGARVVPYLPRRRADGRGYELRILPALADFPGPSPEADALRINRLLEAHIREAPEQYYWVHRRFKGRPPPLPDPYA